MIKSSNPFLKYFTEYQGSIFLETQNIKRVPHNNSGKDGQFQEASVIIKKLYKCRDSLLLYFYDKNVFL